MDGDFSQQVTNLVCDSFIRGVQGNPDASLHEIAQLVAQLGLYTTPLGVLLDNAIEARGEAPPPRPWQSRGKKARLPDKPQVAAWPRRTR